MSSLVDFPVLKVYVNPWFVTNGESKVDVKIEAWLFAVTLLGSRPLLFTVHTIHGAVYSRLPIEALSWMPKPQDNSVDVWGSISSNGLIIQHQHLKDYRCQLLKAERNRNEGRYWCTIDWIDGGFAQNPEQHKTSNIILADSGAIWAVPNNDVLFLDDYFTRPLKNTKDLPYRRNSKYYL